MVPSTSAWGRIAANRCHTFAGGFDIDLGYRIREAGHRIRLIPGWLIAFSLAVVALANIRLCFSGKHVYAVDELNSVTPISGRYFLYRS